MEQLSGPEAALSTRELAVQALIRLLARSGGELPLSTAVQSLADELGVRKLDASVVILEAPDGEIDVDLLHGNVRVRADELMDA